MSSSKQNSQRSNREKARIVREVGRLVFADHYRILDACKEVGVHPSQYYRWKKLQDAEAKGDKDAWKGKSRRPKRLARKTPEPVCDRILTLARSGHYRSANAVAKAMSEELGRFIHDATVINILESEGLYGTIEVRSEDGRVLRRKRGLKVNLQG